MPKKLNDPVKLVDFSTADPTPTDTEERKDYVAKVAGLYTEILEPKLNQMIAASHVLLENGENLPQVDYTLKGTIYAFREFKVWCEKMVKERDANAMGQNPSSED